MGMQKEHRQPEPKLNQTHRHKPWLSLSVFFSVCPFFFWLGNVDLPSAFSSAVWALSSAKSRFLDICLQARLRISAQKYFFFFFLTCTHTQKTKMSDLNPISLTECKGRQGGQSLRWNCSFYRANKKLLHQKDHFTAQAWINNTCFLKEKKKTKGKSKKTEKKPSVLPYYCAF